MSTLLPTPTYNPHIPVITSAGGTSVAYQNPNSPESILRKTTQIQVQSAVDTKYDVALPAHEPTPGSSIDGFQGSQMYIQWIVVAFLAVAALVHKKPFGFRKYPYMCMLIGICIILYLYKRYARGE